MTSDDRLKPVPQQDYTSRNLILYAATEVNSAENCVMDAAQALEKVPDKAGRKYKLIFLVTDLDLLSQRLGLLKDRIIRLLEEGG